MTLNDLVGRQVNVLAWFDLHDVLPTDPSGTITHVADFGDGDVEVTVRIEGLARNYVFGMDEVEILPGCVHARPDARAT